MFGFAAQNAATLTWNGDAKVFVVGLVIGLAAQGWLKARKGWDWLPAIAWPWRVAALAGMSLAIILSPGKTQAFIYFQF
jgi:hypothetical protein